MTKYRLLKRVGGTAVAVSAMVGGVKAESAYPMAKQQSAHFNAVAKQLEMGGLSFEYNDQGAKNSIYTGVLDMVVEFLDQHTEFKGVDAKKLAELFTLDAVKASGSSASQRDGFIHYRSYQYMPGEKSMYALAYGEAKPSVAMELAPAGADLVLEMHMNGSYDPEAEEKMYAALGPVGEMVKAMQAQQGAQEPMMALYNENYKKINSRFSLIADLSPKGFDAAPGMPISGELLISVTNAEPIWQIIKPLIEEQGMKVSENGSVESLVSPEAMGPWQPVLQYNAETHQILIGSSQKYIDLCLSAKKGEVPNLSQDKAVVKLSEGLPEHFSNMVYVSPTLSSTVVNLSQALVVPQIEDEEVARPAVKMLLDKLSGSGVTETGTLYVVSFQDKGSLHVVNSPVNLVGTAGTMTTMGVGLATTSTLFVGASYYRDSANKAACEINMSSMTKAARAVQNINGHEVGDPLKWSMLVGGGAPLADKPVCPSGGTYTLSPTFTENGEPLIQCSCQ
ncbi:hypothetical protein [Rubritalea tangerina]|uniref:Uncharacterized protein n=1 Tax=Rubritalea tangerina TaxID=430798 RepID=A0ABW4Z955_9BACT